MVSQAAVKYNLISWNILSRIGLLPLDFPSLYFPVGKSWGRRMVNNFVMLNSGIYTAFVMFRLVQISDQPLNGFILIAVPVHFINTVGGLAAVLIYWAVFISHWDLNLITIRSLLTGLPSTSSGRPSIRGLTLRYMAFFYPYMATVIEMAKCALPNNPFSFRSLLPDSPLHVLSILCEMWEGYLLLSSVGVANYTMCSNLLFLERCEYDLRIHLKSLSMPAWSFNVKKMHKHLVDIRKLQLRCFYYNTVFSSLVYMFKLLSQVVGVTGIFFCIKLSHRQPLYAVACGFMGISMWMCFIILYDQAFKLPHMVDEFRRRIQLLRWHIRKEDQSKLVKVAMKSVWGIEVRMAGFHSAQRSSTTDFLDFGFGTVANLIITFPN